jgi:hypothetical protein
MEIRIFVKCEVLTAVALKKTVHGDVMPCSLIEVQRLLMERATSIFAEGGRIGK